jgi:hypothetical protein
MSQTLHMIAAYTSDVTFERGGGAGLILIFVGVIVITALVFSLWLLLTVLKLIGRGLASAFRGDKAPQPLSGPTIFCTRSGCRAVNPAHAAYCRRCGHELVKRQVLPKIWT